MFCALCQEACPTYCLELTQDFELATYSRAALSETVRCSNKARDGEIRELSIADFELRISKSKTQVLFAIRN